MSNDNLLALVTKICADKNFREKLDQQILWKNAKLPFVTKVLIFTGLFLAMPTLSKTNWLRRLKAKAILKPEGYNKTSIAA
ncbi:MAG: hypothetical protein GY757_31740 [bacterium]|nr:hypothetical protein [bacterium]